MLIVWILLRKRDNSITLRVENIRHLLALDLDVVLSKELVQADTLADVKDHNAPYNVRGLLEECLTEQFIVKVSRLCNKCSNTAEIDCQVGHQEHDIGYRKYAVKC